MKLRIGLEKSISWGIGIQFYPKDALNIVFICWVFYIEKIYEVTIKEPIKSQLELRDDQE
jgi:hypothetical protein